MPLISTYGSPIRCSTLDVITDITIKDSVRGGGFVRKKSKASSAAMSGASVTIQVNIPATSRILGTQLIVDTLITSGDGGTTWSATYSGGCTDSICSAQAFTKDIAVNSLAGAWATTAETDIILTPNSGTFNAGVVTAVCTYETFEALSAI